MSKEWSLDYIAELEQRLDSIAADLPTRLSDVTKGLVVPGPDDLAIGTGRYVEATVLFFDIRGFTARTGSADIVALKRTLAMLNCVIPMVMKVVHDHDGVIEKNTGDGVMAVFGVGKSTSVQVADALNAAATIRYVIDEIVNPKLKAWQIDPVDFRIGIDNGMLILAKIGVPSGSAKLDRNFITAVGPAANIASKLQQAAGTNEIWVGDRVFKHAQWMESFGIATPPDWNWIYTGTGDPYFVWSFNGKRTKPFDWDLLGKFLGTR